jgi:hypothetical protein
VAGSYSLTDAAYAKLLHKLDGHYKEMPQELRTNLLAFYQDLALPIATRKDASDWARLQDELARLGSIDRELTARSPRDATEQTAK